MRWSVIAAPALLAGCLAAPEPAPVGIIFDHDEMVVAMEGQYLWNCTMGNNSSDETFRFVLARRVFSGESVVTLEEAGRDLVEEVTEEPDTGDGRDIFQLSDASRLIIEADGLAYGGGVTQSRLARFTEGRCTPGDQQ